MPGGQPDSAFRNYSVAPGRTSGYAARHVTLFRGLCVALVAALGLLPLAPPAHVHDTVDEAGHHGLVAHRHAESHGPFEAVRQLRGHEPTHIEDPESVVATLDPVFVAPAAPDLAPPGLVPVLWTRSDDSSRPLARAPFVERQIHGPPRAPAATRGPPALS